MWNRHAESMLLPWADLLLSETVQCLAGDLGGYSGGSPPTGEQPSSRFGHPGVPVGTLASSVDSLAKEVEPERFHFYGVPSFNSVPFLDDENRHRFQRRFDFACSNLKMIWSCPFLLSAFVARRKIRSDCLRCWTVVDGSVYCQKTECG